MLCLGVIQAQVNDSQRSIKIDPIDSLKQKQLKKFSIKPPKQAHGLTNKNFNYSLNLKPLADFTKKRKGVDISDNSRLPSPEWKINQRFSEDYKDVGRFAKDFNLGNLKTTSKTIVLRCRDHEYVDGDRIKLMVNNATIHPNLTLRGDFYTIDIDLKEGMNTIYFIALNEGTSSPNTAQLQVLDPEGNVLASNRWLIRTGYKASLTVYKQ